MIERFMRHVSPEPNSGCWLWTSTCTRGGYGRFTVARGHLALAHRFAFEHFKGVIPNGLHLDHKCRVRSCCNPDHLEPVTPRENLLRGEGFAAKNARKTHCVHGHEYTPENTLAVPGGRTCRKCRVATERRFRERRKLSADGNPPARKEGES